MLTHTSRINQEDSRLLAAIWWQSTFFQYTLGYPAHTILNNKNFVNLIFIVWQIFQLCVTSQRFMALSMKG